MKKDPSPLIRKIREGSDAAFTDLCGMYKALTDGAAEKYSAGLAREDETVRDDFRQEAILALYRAAMTYDLDQNKVTFGLYAKTCVRNALITLIRKAKSGPKVSGELYDEDTASADDFAEKLLSAEMIDALSQRFAEVLTPYELEVFTRYLEGEKPREIAKALGKDAKSASNAIFRARVKVKPLVGRPGEE